MATRVSPAMILRHLLFHFTLTDHLSIICISPVSSSCIIFFNLYISNDSTGAAEAIADVDVSSLPVEEAKTLYNTISGATMMNAANDLYNRGMTAYNKADYTTAADLLVRAYKCDKTKADAVFYAAKSYVALNQPDNAKKYYQIIADEFKSSGYVTEAQAYVQSH